jgi:hypothetical protein
MNIDWNTLNNKTKEFRTLKVIRDPSNTIVDVVFSGLEVKLSELVKFFPFVGGATLTIYADTVIVDAPSFDARGTVVMARSIDMSMLVGSPVPVRVPEKGRTAVAEFLVKETIGGNLQLTTSNAQPGKPAFTVPIGEKPLQAVYYFVNSDGSSTQQVQTDVSALQDLISLVWALNSLKASFTAASWLMNSNQSSDRSTAKSMLSWVVACIRTMGGGGATIPSDYAELYSQAAALLVTLNVAQGAYYVPILSSSFYKTQINLLLGALQSYENNLNTLNVQTDIQAAIQKVSGTLQGVAQDEANPQHIQLNNIQENLDTLSKDIRNLAHQYDLQSIDANTCFALMQNAIAQQKIKQFLEAGLKLGLDAVNIGFSVAKAAATENPLELAEAFQGFVEGVQHAYEGIEAISSDNPSNRTLLDQAQLLMQMQKQLMTSFYTGAVLWAEAQKEQSGTELPESLASVSIDPNLAWENYMIQAEAELTTIKETIGSGTGAEPAQEAANKYLASLKILAQYGKALDAKVVAYSSLLAEATVVKAEIRASQNIEKRWQELERNAKSNEDKLAALKGMNQTRTDAIKRSIYLAWTHYRNSYFYLYFQEPPITINLEMNAATLKEKFATLSQWIAQLLGDVPDNQIVRLPNENVEISFQFTIVKQGNLSVGSKDIALLTPANGNQPATLTWGIPIGNTQLQGVLPNKGNVAIWIKEARFFIDGIKSNSNGNVLLNVLTSGTYQNGYGPGKAYSFVTKGLEGEYAYRVQGENVYDPWEINTEVYATPTPYTQWTITFDPDGGDPSLATRLRMVLKVAYRSKK